MQELSIFVEFLGQVRDGVFAKVDGRILRVDPQTGALCSDVEFTAAGEDEEEIIYYGVSR